MQKGSWCRQVQITQPRKGSWRRQVQMPTQPQPGEKKVNRWQKVRNGSSRFNIVGEMKPGSRLLRPCEGRHIVFIIPPSLHHATLWLYRPRKDTCTERKTIVYPLSGTIWALSDIALAAQSLPTAHISAHPIRR